MGKLSQTRSTYFKPEGTSSTLYPARINANLGDLSDGPVKDKKTITISEKDTEIAELQNPESAALQSHLLWLTDLLIALTKRREQPNAVLTIQQILSKVFQH